MTKWEIGKLQGAHEFESLCNQAVEGLEERPHEVKAWAATGMKQYHITKDLATKMKKDNESLVEAQASVGDLQQGDFEHVESFAHNA